MSLNRISGPTVEPVTLPEAKIHLRVEHDEENALIQQLIVTAREQAEHATCRALTTQTWERVLDAFPVGGGAIELAMPPVQSIASVKLINLQGSIETLAPAAYSLDVDTQPGWLLPAAGYEWPATLDAANAVRVRFVCGYGADGSFVPASIRQYILAHVGHWHCHRGAVSDKKLEPVPYLERLLDSFRVWL